MTKPKLPPSNRDTLAFRKKDQLDKKGAIRDTALPFSKQQQLGQPVGGTRPTPSTITRPRPSLPDADLPVSKPKQMGKAPGSKTHPAR